jgi:hypothetical protein
VARAGVNQPRTNQTRDGRKWFVGFLDFLKENPVTLTQCRNRLGNCLCVDITGRVEVGFPTPTDQRSGGWIQQR